MTTANVAAVNAVNYFRSLTGFGGASMLEEVELTEEGAKKFWLITLSYNPHMMPGGAPVVVFGQSSAKEYKQFKVDADDGNVLSMKIRTIR